MSKNFLIILWSAILLLTGATQNALPIRAAWWCTTFSIWCDEPVPQDPSIELHSWLYDCARSIW